MIKKRIDLFFFQMQFLNYRINFTRQKSKKNIIILAVA